MHSFAMLVDTIVSLYIWVLIAGIVLTWLIHFNIVNAHQPFVRGVGQFCHRLTEPLLRPIRRVVPLVGGIDISPVILILLIHFARNLLWEYAF